MRLHALVFCWPGQVDNAFEIARRVRGHVDRLTVLDAAGAELPADLAAAEDVEWRSIDPAFYYGSKFKLATELFDGDVLLQIQADARSDDWPAVCRECRRAFDEHADLGVWSPDVWFTLFPTDQVTLYRLGESERYVVAQSDCIVWALARPVVERLGRLDYSANNFGWGIDWAALTYCFANKLLVVRDKAVLIQHPRSRNYDTVAAREQMFAFMEQFEPAEHTQFRLLEGFISATNMGVKGHAQALARAARRAVETRVRG